MGAIYLIRHGQASFGSTNYDRLSDTGRQQAQACGRYLAAKGLQLDYWFSGTLERQQDTASLALAEVVSKHTEVRQDPGFNEFDHTLIFAKILPLLDQNDPDILAFFRARGDRHKYFQAVFEKTVSTWLAQDHGADIESWPEFRSRVTEAFDGAVTRAGPGRNSVIVTSGGPIAVVLADTLKLSPQAALGLNWSLANTSITKIFYCSGRRSVGYFNQYSYLQNAADRSLVTFR